MSELSSELHACSARIDGVLHQLLPLEQTPPCDLHRAMRYAVLGGGKRLRPLLVYATGQMLNAGLDALDASAAAVEIIHAYSLVHDDLPAMDNDDLRRGRPTCHIVFGQATAILAGDALQALAFEVLAKTPLAAGLEPSIRLEMIRTLAEACGSRGMVGGQSLDLGVVGQKIDLDTLEHMHSHKTGALIRAAVRLGALAAECRDRSVLDALDEYAYCIGMAFQIRDDILDVEGETTVIGKRQGADQALNKPTYPALLGLSGAREHLAKLTERAVNALSGFGDEAEGLQKLAHFAAIREK